jgi:CRISPR system Cascade subunit CasA
VFSKTEVSHTGEGEGMGDSGHCATFNLISEKWIPVILVDGTTDEVSIIDAFANAVDIKEIVGDIPQQELPILRLLLSILYRAYPVGSARESDLLALWLDIWSKRMFDMEAIGDYLDAFEERFNLIDARYPFYQVAGLKYAKKKCDSVSELVADVPKPDKCLFSMRERNQPDSLSFAEAARWVVFQQSYSIAGIRTPPYGNTCARIPAPKGRVGTGLLGAMGSIFLEGKTLFETLLLNWVLFDERSKDHLMFGNDSDIPSWEKDSQSFEPRLAASDEPAGPVGEFTWQSRRIRLVTDEDTTHVTGVFCCYGDAGTVVDKQNVETMTAWYSSKPQQKKLGTPYVPLMPLMHDPSRAIWRGLAPLLSWSGGDDVRPTVVRWLERFEAESVLDCSEVGIHAQGMCYGKNDSSYIDGINDSFRIGTVLVNHESSACARAVEVVSLAEKAVDQLAFFVHNVRRASGDKAAGDAARTASDMVRESAYSELDNLFRERLACFPEGEEEALVYCEEWRDEIHRRMLALANDFVSTSACSHFSEHEGMTVGKASATLRAGLNKALGAMHSAKAGHEGPHRAVDKANQEGM